MCIMTLECKGLNKGNKISNLGSPLVELDSWRSSNPDPACLLSWLSLLWPFAAHADKKHPSKIFIIIWKCNIKKLLESFIRIAAFNLNVSNSNYVLNKNITNVKYLDSRVLILFMSKTYFFN